MFYPSVRIKNCKNLFSSKTRRGKIAIIALMFEATKLVHKSNPHHHIDRTKYQRFKHTNKLRYGSSRAL